MDTHRDLGPWLLKHCADKVWPTENLSGELGSL